MISATYESESDRYLDRRHVNLSNDAGVLSPGKNMERLNYHSSILHLYHQQMNHSSLLTSSIPELSPSPLSTIAGGFPNLHHVSMLETEYQRQVRFQAELYYSSNFNHLSGIPFQTEDLRNQSHMIRCNADSVGKVSTMTKNKADVDSDVPVERELFGGNEQKSEISLPQNHPDSMPSKVGHSKAPNSKPHHQSKPAVENHAKVDTKWNASYEQLRQYKEIHGHTIVPRGYSLNSKLASWVAEQRKQYRLLLDNRKSAITPNRIKLLEEIEFVWNAQEEAWRRQMRLLRKFHAEHGHCNVQIHNPDYPKLGLWVKEQRRHYMLMKQGRTSHMTLDRFRLLSELDFCYDTHESTWQQRLAELGEFKRVNGHCVVSSNNANAKLAVWVHHQRRQYKKMLMGLPSHMNEERMKALNDIDFVWFPRKKPGNLDQDVFDSDKDETDDISIDPRSDDSLSDEGDDGRVYIPAAKRRKS